MTTEYSYNAWGFLTLLRNQDSDLPATISQFDGNGGGSDLCYYASGNRMRLYASAPNVLLGRGEATRMTRCTS